MPDYFKAILLGIVEGLTEFLPVSSTGHLLLADHWLGYIGGSKAFADMFVVVIQLGAILSVVVYFRKRIMELLVGPGKAPLTRPAESDPAAPVLTPEQRKATLLNLLIACLPLGIAAALDDVAEQYFYYPTPIAITLIVGGVLIILIERLRLSGKTQRMEQMSWKQALAIGSAQILAALFPGTSRSAATILAGLGVGLSRYAAAEFSFFLAIPAMFGGSALKLYKFLKTDTFTTDQLMLLLLGSAVSFLVAWAVIAWLMHYIRRHTFTPFGYYRIALGILVLFALSSAGTQPATAPPPTPGENDFPVPTPISLAR